MLHIRSLEGFFLIPLCTPIKWLESITLTTPNVSKYVKLPELLFTVVEMKIDVANLGGIVWHIFIMLNVFLSYESAFVLLAIYPAKR